MTHDELLANIIDYGQNGPIDYGQIDLSNVLRAVVELHKPRTDEAACIHCSKTGFWIAYPCPTIQTIEKELG